MDYEQITAAMGLATSAVGITEKAAATAAAIKGLFEREKSADTGEAAKLLNTLTAELTMANVQNMQLSEALKSLSQELQRQDEFEREKSRYELFETGERDIVFKLKVSEANGQPVHFICPVCLNRDKLFSFITGDGDYKVCQTDNTHIFQFQSLPVRQPDRLKTSWDVLDPYGD